MLPERGWMSAGLVGNGLLLALLCLVVLLSRFDRGESDGRHIGEWGNSDVSGMNFNIG